MDKYETVLIKGSNFDEACEKAIAFAKDNWQRFVSMDSPQLSENCSYIVRVVLLKKEII